MIHRNCFEILDRESYLEHMKHCRDGYIINKYYTSAKYIFHACSFKDNLSRDNFVYQDDYYYVDENMKIINYEDGSNTHFRKDVWGINYNTIKYLLNKKIISLVNDSDMALINLLYK